MLHNVCLHVEWSKEALIEAWMADPQAACEMAGVTLPYSKSGNCSEQAAP